MSSHVHKPVRFTVIAILLVSIGVFAAAQEKKNATPLANKANTANTATNQVLTASKHVNPKLPPAKAKGACHVSGELPDSKCTPGVADSAVTQANIQKTICKAGYAGGIRNKF